MGLTLRKLVLNGASRHRLSKGFILAGEPQRPPTSEARDAVAREAVEAISRAGLRGFAVTPRASHASLIGLETPFMPVYDYARRESFISKLVYASACLSAAARKAGFRLVAAGVNPYEGDVGGKPTALCADLHQVEIYDDGEVERIYNLYRQYLPELLALSAHSSVYAGEPQKDFSARMRVNPSSFLPRYLSQFAAEHLQRLERTVRRAYGIADLRQMDVNPLGGDGSILGGAEPLRAPAPLLGETAAAVELRFIDAQCSYSFIRAQIIILQSIAMYGRTLARQGRRLPYMRDEVIDENKALAIQSGSLAILKPDPTFKRDDGRQSLWFHDRGTPERAPTSLLSIIDEKLLPPLRDLMCTPEELAPVVLGAELRRRGKRCLVNYGEYQQYIFYTSGRDFAAAYQQRLEALLSPGAKDYLSEYNRQAYPELAAEVEHDWEQKLTARPSAHAPRRQRVHGHVKWFDEEKGFGSLEAEGMVAVFVHQAEVVGGALRPGEAVSFEVAQSARGLRALRVRRDPEE